MSSDLPTTFFNGQHFPVVSKVNIGEAMWNSNNSINIIPITTNPAVPQNSVYYMPSAATSAVIPNNHLFEIKYDADKKGYIVNPDAGFIPVQTAPSKSKSKPEVKLLLEDVIWFHETSEMFHVDERLNGCKPGQKKMRRVSKNDAQTILKHFKNSWCETCRKVIDEHYGKS